MIQGMLANMKGNYISYSRSAMTCVNDCFSISGVDCHSNTDCFNDNDVCLIETSEGGRKTKCV